MKQKILSNLFVFQIMLFIIFLGSVGCTQTNKIKEDVDTSNWKTYTNIQYGFEFKYPDFLQPALKGNGSVNERPVRSISLVDKSKPLTELMHFQIDSNGNLNGLNIEDWYADQIKNIDKSKPIPKTDIIVNGKSAIKLDYSPFGSAQYHVIVLLKKDIFYINYPVNNETFEKILSTFKFNEVTSK